MLGGAYIAYPIDQARLDPELLRQISYMEKNLVAMGLVKWTFDPGDGFRVSKFAPVDRSIGHINRCAHVNADLIVAFLPAGVPSIGVPLEIDRAVAQGKQVVVFSDAESWMLTYPGDRIIRYTDWSTETLESALDFIAGLAPLNAGDEGHRQPDDLPVKINDGGSLPMRAYADDAGLDLVVSERTTILPGTFADVPCGISVELPYWSWGLVTGRSSALRGRGLLVHSGIIDAGYRGPLFAGAFNMTSEPVTVEQGERIAQLIVLQNSTRRVMPLAVAELGPSDRGTNGFGSSGA